MRRMLVCGVVLAVGVLAAAWLGRADATVTVGAISPARLNTAARHKLTTAPRRPGSAERDDSHLPQRLYDRTRSLIPMAKPLSSPGAGEWRQLVREPEQDLTSFCGESRQARGVLVLQPIGDLPPDQQAAIPHLLDAMAHFFGMASVCAPAIPLTALPEGCFRQRDGIRQINADYLMDNVLRLKVGGDVASVLALTTLDLYPGTQWPFETAFGWSSFTAGTSVLSTRQILEARPADRGRNLMRLIKLCLHELSHTFTMKHCATYACLMNGCGNVAEIDTRPLFLSPECLAKLAVATGREPEWHLRSMMDFCKAKGFFQEANAFHRALTRLETL